MKWVSHKIVSFSVVYFLTSDLVASVLTGAGAVLPDLLEGKDFHTKAWQKTHRTITHWFLGWLILVFSFLSYFYFRFHNFPWAFDGVKLYQFFLSGRFFHSQIFSELAVCFFGFYLSLGGLLHIIEDAMSASVPLFNPFHRSFRLAGIRVGSFEEALIVLLFIFLFLFKFF
jgi:uncharacterized membrane protein